MSFFCLILIYSLKLTPVPLYFFVEVPTSSVVVVVVVVEAEAQAGITATYVRRMMTMLLHHFLLLTLVLHYHPQKNISHGRNCSVLRVVPTLNFLL